MPRSRSGSRGRDRSRIANRNVAPRYEDFDERWLRAYQERQWSRLIDLTRIQDRRRWHPNKMRNIPVGPARENVHRPRIVIVPEGHRLARLAPYGGRVPLHKVLRSEYRIRRRSLDEPREYRLYDKYGVPYHAFIPDHLSRRVGFQFPWQVMICIRRKRRREVLHALNVAGRIFRAGGGGGGFRRPRRNRFSEVRC